MSTPKIVLFCVFAPPSDPEAGRGRQHAVCSAHDLRGRIIVSRHRINATVGDDIDQRERYVRSMREYPAFRDADAARSAGRNRIGSWIGSFVDDVTLDVDRTVTPGVDSLWGGCDRWVRPEAR